ncbi:hypothetical protein ACFQ0O_27045 [Saccharopolyspora spinosporotrichia]
MRRQRTAACLVGALCVMTGGLGAVSQAAAPEVELDGDRVVVSLAGGRAVVDPATLEVKARTADGREWQLSAPAAEPLGPAGEVRVEDGRASWRYPGMTVTAAEQAGRLSIAVHADRDTAMTWPVTGTDPGVSEMQFPRGEGLSVPVADPWWNSGQARLAGSEAEMVGGLTMPFWGHSGAGRGVSYIAENDIGTSLRFVSQRGRLHAETVHDFSAREGTLDHAVTFALTDGSPVAPARTTGGGSTSTAVARPCGARSPRTPRSASWSVPSTPTPGARPARRRASGGCANWASTGCGWATTPTGGR